MPFIGPAKKGGGRSCFRTNQWRGTRSKRGKVNRCRGGKKNERDLYHPPPRKRRERLRGNEEKGKGRGEGQPVQKRESDRPLPLS